MLDLCFPRLSAIRGRQHYPSLPPPSRSELGLESGFAIPASTSGFGRNTIVDFVRDHTNGHDSGQLTLPGYQVSWGYLLSATTRFLGWGQLSTSTCDSRSPDPETKSDLEQLPVHASRARRPQEAHLRARSDRQCPGLISVTPRRLVFDELVPGEAATGASGLFFLTA